MKKKEKRKKTKDKKSENTNSLFSIEVQVEEINRGLSFKFLHDLMALTQIQFPFIFSFFFCLLSSFFVLIRVIRGRIKKGFRVC